MVVVAVVVAVAVAVAVAVVPRRNRDCDRGCRGCGRRARCEYGRARYQTLILLVREGVGMAAVVMGVCVLLLSRSRNGEWELRR